jgi:hypothetical protein
MNTRLANLILTVIITIALIILTISYSYAPNRILKLLGGEVPHGLIQLATYFFFFYGMLEVLRFNRYVENQSKGLSLDSFRRKNNLCSQQMKSTTLN